MAAIGLYGAGNDGAVITSLTQSDSAEDGSLVASLVPLSSGRPPLAFVPGRLLAHLLALPSRVGALVPEHAPSSSADLAARLAATTSPHLLAIGQSGSGKSTLAAHQGVQALDGGRILVAVDVHDGDMVRRLHSAAIRLDRPVLYVDLSPSNPHRPALRLADPPPGVSEDQWVEELWWLLRYTVWAAVRDDFFGPVGEKCTRVGLSLAVRDPAREFGLSMLNRLLDPREGPFRAFHLGRIGDDELTRAVSQDIMPMLTSRDPGNNAAWVKSKTEPFTHPLVRGVLEGSFGRVPIDEALARGCSILIHAPMGELGKDAVRVLVATFLHRIRSAILRGIPSAGIYEILDEWQNYADGELLASQLAEGRKYGLGMVLCNQVFSQLSDELRDTVLSNVGAVACYRTGPRDAVTLDGMFPTIRVVSLQQLPAYTMALTTFDTDVVIGGPPPLPPCEEEPAPWDEQLTEFWGGPEPDLPVVVVVAELSDITVDDGVTSAELIDAWSSKRSGRKG